MQDTPKEIKCLHICYLQPLVVSNHKFALYLYNGLTIVISNRGNPRRRDQYVSLSQPLFCHNNSL